MKKFSMAALVVALFFSLIQTQLHVVHASGEGTESFTIPKETSTTEAVKTYEFKYPAGVDRILGTGYSISGGGTIEAFLPDSTNRILTVRVRGKNTSVDAKKVTGSADNTGRKFRSNPGNAMCRYADGVRWQINSYRSNGDPYNFNVNASGPAPAAPPWGPIGEIIAFVTPTLNPSGAYWTDGTNRIQWSDIDPATVEVPQTSSDS